jgi:hypothetical protein
MKFFPMHLLFAIATICVNIYAMDIINQQMVPEESISFDRETIIEAEGYWALSENQDEDFYKGKYPFPQKNEHPWHGQEVFLQKLEMIEKQAQYYSFHSKDDNTGVRRLCYRGDSPSRFEPDVLCGSSEFIYKDSNDKKIKWTVALRYYYVAKFNVKPSREFYQFIKNFALGKQKTNSVSDTYYQIKTPSLTSAFLFSRL